MKQDFSEASRAVRRPDVIHSSSFVAIVMHSPSNLKNSFRMMLLTVSPSLLRATGAISHHAYRFKYLET